MSMSSPNLDIVRRWPKADREHFARRYPNTWNDIQERFRIEQQRKQPERLKRLQFDRDRHRHALLRTLWKRVFLHRPPTPHVIGRMVSEASGISWKDIAGPRRSAECIAPRMAFVWLCRAHTTKSFPQLGHLCSRRDHATMINANRRAQQALDGIWTGAKANAIRSIVSAVEARLK